MHIRSPQTEEEFEQYFDLRWRILRQPWQQPRGSERDAHEDSSFHLMAMENSRVIAVARLQFMADSSAQLRYMAVDENWRKQGVGRQILLYMEEHARQHDIDEIMLHAREKAVPFYRKLGYETVEKSYRLFDEIQHYKMRKKL